MQPQQPNPWNNPQQPNNEPAPTPPGYYQPGQQPPPVPYQQPGYPQYQQPQPGYPPQQYQQPQYQQPYYPPQPVQVNVTSNTIVNNKLIFGKQHPSAIVRILYFLIIGWWFGFIWLLFALLACVTVVGIPAGVLMLAKTPSAFFL